MLAIKPIQKPFLGQLHGKNLKGLEKNLGNYLVKIF